MQFNLSQQLSYDPTIQTFSEFILNTKKMFRQLLLKNTHFLKVNIKTTLTFFRELLPNCNMKSDLFKSLY